MHIPIGLTGNGVAKTGPVALPRLWDKGEGGGIMMVMSLPLRNTEHPLPTTAAGPQRLAPTWRHTRRVVGVNP